MADDSQKLTPEHVRQAVEAAGWSWHLVLPSVSWPGDEAGRRDLLLAQDAGGAGLLYLPRPDGGFELALRDEGGVVVLLGRLVDPREGRRSLPEGRVGLTDFAAVSAALERQRQAVPTISAQELLGRLEASVRGQTVALGELAERVTLHIARPRPRRPLSVFALGPTGVGKTLCAETLASALAPTRAADGDGWGYLRLDMSEYSEAHRVSQLLGAPPGYAGYAEGTPLLDRLEERPRTVVLFDEIEKAHQSILKALMNALDAGRLSRTGRGQVDCRQAIFFFTSNAGASEVEAALARQGGGPMDIEEQCRRVLLKEGIAPELVGRMSCLLAFRPLTVAAEAEVAALTFERIAREYDLEITYVDPELVAALLGAGEGKGFGARPLAYRVDKLCGTAFLDAARMGGSGPWRLVAGPPPFLLPETDFHRGTP